MEVIAHRAGNDPDLIVPALDVADAVELDVHLLRGRLEVRHSKAIWPFRRYWERGIGLLSDEHPVGLDAILAAAPADARLWIDLKGFSGRFTRRVLREVGDRPAITMSSRSWWVLRPARRAGVRTYRSVGNRAQRWLALRLRHPGGVVMHERLATPGTIDRLRARCSGIAVWAIEEPRRAAELRELGIVAVIVDDLDLASALRAAA